MQPAGEASAKALGLREGWRVRADRDVVREEWAGSVRPWRTLLGGRREDHLGPGERRRESGLPLRRTSPRLWQRSRFKMAVTETAAAAEMARRGWVLGLPEGREDGERNVEAEKRPCPG